MSCQLSAIFIGSQPPRSVFFGNAQCLSVFTFQQGIRSVFSEMGQQGPSGPPGGGGTELAVSMTQSENDWNLSSANFQFIITPSENWNLTGIANGTPARVIRLYNNSGTYNITLLNETTSESGNQFSFPFVASGGIGAILSPGDSIQLTYDGVNGYWRP